MERLSGLLAEKDFLKLMSLRYRATRLPTVDSLESIKQEVNNVKLTSSCISVYTDSLTTTREAIEKLQPDIEGLYRSLASAIAILKNPDEMKKIFITFIADYEFELLKAEEQERQLPQLPFYGNDPEIKQMVSACYPELIEALEAFGETNLETLSEKRINSLLKNKEISPFFEKFTEKYMACLEEAERALQALLTASRHLKQMDEFIDAQLKHHSKPSDNQVQWLTRSMQKSILSQSKRVVTPPAGPGPGPARMLSDSLLSMDVLDQRAAPANPPR